MNTLTILGLALISLFVLYQVGFFDMFSKACKIANREVTDYDRMHKEKVARRYLDKEVSFTETQVKKINSNIKAIDELNFD